MKQLLVISLISLLFPQTVQINVAIYFSFGEYAQEVKDAIDYSWIKDGVKYEIVPEMEAILKGESPLMNKSGKVINIIREICDGCPLPSYHITNMCRNCSAKYCINSCPRNAIVTTDKRPEIDLEKCVGCGLCAKNCPYGAIMKMDLS